MRPTRATVALEALTRRVERLQALGFDLSESLLDGDDVRSHVRCSQCQALVINGVPAHETGCPNFRPTAIRSFVEQDVTRITPAPRNRQIIRFRFHGRPRVLRRGLTLAEAQAWCSRTDTHDTRHTPPRWFDGYDYMPGCAPDPTPAASPESLSYGVRCVACGQFETACTCPEPEGGPARVEDTVTHITPPSTVALIVILQTNTLALTVEGLANAPELGPLAVIWSRLEREGTATCLAASVSSPLPLRELRDRLRTWATARGWSATIAPAGPESSQP